MFYTLNTRAHAHHQLVLVVVIVWFPLTAAITEAMETFEILFAFLQFLGLYSNFAISFPEPLASVSPYTRSARS